jgi:hypothetical protein
MANSCSKADTSGPRMYRPESSTLSTARMSSFLINEASIAKAE